MPESKPGTPIPVPDNFPVTWEHPDDVRLHWERDTEHMAGPSSPLMGSLNWVHEGMRHGLRYWEAPVADTVRQRIHTFEFSAIVPLDASPEEIEARNQRAEQKLQGVLEDLSGIWERSWWPRIESALQTLDGLRFEAVTDGELAECVKTADEAGLTLWAVHFELVFACGFVRSELDRFCRDLFGPDTVFQTSTLTAGDYSWSVANGEALFELAEWVTSHPRLAQVVESGGWPQVEASLPGVEGGAEFEARFRRFIEVHGTKLVGGLVDPTWDEDPTLALDNLRAVIARGGDVGRAQRARVVAERDARLAAVRERLKTYPRAVATEFEGLLASAQVASRLMEDHNYYIDQKSFYHFHRLVMAFGRRLAAHGRLDRPEDVQYLEKSELVPALQGQLEDVRGRVRQRRTEMERWQDFEAPTELGTVGQPFPPHPLFGGGPPPAGSAPPAEELGVLRGLPASRGQVTGTARVCRSIADAPALKPGEILVTPTTNPSWATWYPVLGGLVTEAGGVLSHAAVVAREYGIPAVVAVPDATGRIGTGTRLVLNGDDGTVRILD
ncbi:MAG: PEP-utilizing enzyme [Clostridia bacterium]